MDEPVRPASWWFLVAVVLLAVAGFFCLLATTTPVRGAGDLVALTGTVASVTRDQSGDVVITLSGSGPALRLLRADQEFLDEAAFRQGVLPGSTVTAQVIRARLQERDDSLTVFGLIGPEGSYLLPEPLIAGRLREALLLFPSIALALGAVAAGAIWLGSRDVHQQRTLWRDPPPLARYEVGTGLVRAIGTMALLMFGAFTGLALANQQPGAAACFVAFVLLGLALALGSGTIAADREAITVRSPLTHHRIAWAEVVEVAHDGEMQQLVFRGADKQLVIPGPRFWSGPHRLLLYDYLAQEITRRVIPIRVSGNAAFAWSRGTRAERR